MAGSRMRIIGAVGAVLVLLVIVAVFLLRPRSASAPTAPTGTKASDAPQAVVYIDGQRLAGPYAVTANGSTVQVNGKTVTELGAPASDDAKPAPAANDDAFTIVSEVRRAYIDAGGGDQGVAAAMSMLQSHPGRPRASEQQQPRRIEVTDAAGLVVSFQLVVPDSAARKVDAAQLAQRAKELADQIGTLLSGGGGFIASKSGVTMMLPAEGVREFVDALTAAQAQAGTAKDAALTELLQAPGLIEDFGGKAPGLPPARASFERGDGDGRSSLPVTLRRDVGAAPARTPGSSRAWVFAMTQLNDADSQPFINATLNEGYNTWIYRNPTDGFRMLALTSNTGALYIVSHSGPGGVAVEHFANRAAANAAVRSLRDRGVPAGDLYTWAEAGDGGFWISMSRSGISRYWSGTQTIVHAASCEGETLFDVFRAREFYGYQPTTSCAIALPDTRELWGRLSGVIDQGRYRYASAAFTSGRYSAGFRYHDGSPNEETALSPSVVSAQIPELFVGEEGAVLIAFDTVMNTRTAADGIVAVLGCLQRSGAANWQFDSLLSVPVKATAKGDATVTVSWALATSAIAFIKLDGNTNPKQSGVAPNRDDWTGSGGCKESRTAVQPTPTSQTAGRRAPIVTQLEAKLTAPITTFRVTANDPDKPSDPLTYAWSMSGELCGTPKVPWKQTGATVTWSHSNAAPDSCEHIGTDHAVTTTVVVTSSSGASTTCTIKGTEDQKLVNPPCTP